MKIQILILCLVLGACAEIDMGESSGALEEAIEPEGLPEEDLINCWFFSGGGGACETEHCSIYFFPDGMIFEQCWVDYP